ncbi:MAG: histidine phosphatase family protein [Cyclobacteriaceae bacterium]|nr:histidine phosphatase family protein [Cyclobacteriaceae bacterium]
MTKRLYLVRHAKTEERSMDMRDFDRELTSRGMQDSTHLGKYYATKSMIPDLILSSDAARARETAELIASQMGYDLSRIHLNHEIYEASVRTLFQLVTQLKDEWDSVMIVGHNPVMNYLAEYLSGAEIGHMFTGSAACIAFEVESWSEVSQSSGTLEEYVIAKHLES